MAADITEYRVKISGDRLMHHNGQLANPLNEYTKELKAVVKAAKKSKSDVDIEAVYKAGMEISYLPSMPSGASIYDKPLK